jgi:hypothetical protein
VINLTPADAQRLERSIRRQAKAAQKRWHTQQSDDDARLTVAEDNPNRRCPGCEHFATVHPCYPNCGNPT